MSSYSCSLFENSAPPASPEITGSMLLPTRYCDKKEIKGIPKSYVFPNRFTSEGFLMLSKGCIFRPHDFRCGFLSCLVYCAFAADQKDPVVSYLTSKIRVSFATYMCKYIFNSKETLALVEHLHRQAEE